ncbi:MAG: hypothetical protein J6T17_08905 [Clostridia bacterium]|nr:hypothetical protein [Clostridia bacterium]
MATVMRNNLRTRLTAVGLVLLFLFCLVALPAEAEVNALRNAFNPRGFFLTLKNGEEPEWLRSSFVTGFYRTGEGGGGGGGGQGANEEKDDLGHSNVTYVDEEVGLDFVDVADVDTIYSTYDHNPTPGKDFMVGYYKQEQSAALSGIPGFAEAIGTPKRGSETVKDPSGGQWWNVPVRLALEPGTLYEFAYLRGNQANNGTTCVLMPGEAEGTYKGYISFKEIDELPAAEREAYDTHKYDEYEFVTAILPAGTAGDPTADHTIESVPMRYHIQTYADLAKWTESAERGEAETFLASVSESDYASGKYVRENVAALQTKLTSLKEEAEASVKYQLQKDAEQTIQQMNAELRAALETAKAPGNKVDLTAYNAALASAQTTYDSIKDKTGTAVDQYRPGPVDALKQAIDRAKNTIGDHSTQAAIDAETAALNSARMAALDALIRPDERIFQDATTGIIVTAPAAALPASATLAVREVAGGSNEYNAYKNRITPAPSAAAIYRIVFYDGANVVTPTQPVTVQIPLRNDLVGLSPSVYYLDGTNARARKLNASAVSGYRVFTTSQLGTFAVAGTKASVPTRPTTRSTTRRTNRWTTRRTTTRTTTRRTTRILRTTRDPNNDQNRRNEVSSTSVLQTQAVQPVTQTTTVTVPSAAAQDTSDLSQEPNRNGLLYIALAIAGVGIGAAVIEFLKDRNSRKDNDDLEL